MRETESPMDKIVLLRANSTPSQGFPSGPTSAEANVVSMVGVAVDPPLAAHVLRKKEAMSAGAVHDGSKGVQRFLWKSVASHAR